MVKNRARLRPTSVLGQTQAGPLLRVFEPTASSALWVLPTRLRETLQPSTGLIIDITRSDPPRLPQASAAPQRGRTPRSSERSEAAQG